MTLTRQAGRILITRTKEYAQAIASALFPQLAVEPTLALIVALKDQHAWACVSPAFLSRPEARSEYLCAQKRVADSEIGPLSSRHPRGPSAHVKDPPARVTAPTSGTRTLRPCPRP